MESAASMIPHPDGARQSTATTPLDQARLDALAEAGYAWFIDDAEMYARLDAEGFPVLHLPDPQVLSAKAVRRLKGVVVFMPPSFAGTLYGHKVKQQLEALGWQGWLTRTPFPDDIPDFSTAVARYPDRAELGAFFLGLTEHGIFEQLGQRRPRAPTASKLAERIAERLRGSVTYEVQRQRWMAYGARQPGIWGELPDVEMYDRVRQALTGLLPDGFSWPFLQGVERLLRTLCKGDLAEPSRAWLPFRNGALHLPTGRLEDHTSERGFTWCLPFDYDTTATCQPIERWLLEAQDHDKTRVRVLLANLKAILTGRTDLQRFVECIGPGGTGKGTYQRLAMALVGLENVCTTTLQQLETNRFETARLEAARLVAITDADKYGGPINVLKALTGSDPLRGERKFREARDVIPEAMVLVAANEAIQSTDYTSGLERRRITVPFQHKPTAVRQLLEFHRGEVRGEFAAYLPGLINRVLSITDADMERLLRHTPQAAPSLQAAWQRALVETNPLAGWADAHLLLTDPEETIQVGLARRQANSDHYEAEDRWLYPSYRAYAEAAGIKPLSLPRFPRLLDDFLRHQLRLPDAGWEHDGQRAYFRGIRLRRLTDKDCPGLIAASMPDISSHDAGVDEQTHPEPPSPAILGDQVGEKTQEYSEFRGFRGFSAQRQISTDRPAHQNGAGAIEQGVPEKPPKPPKFTTDGGLRETQPPKTPGTGRQRVDQFRRTKERGGWIWPVPEPLPHEEAHP